jgi:hypothetical protein|tara:strand:- start:948 stop:1109 length:162 start_codon:yes stop_codon:yes gene_type:complete
VPDGVTVAFVLGVEELDAVRLRRQGARRGREQAAFSAITGPGIFSFYDWPDDG